MIFMALYLLSETNKLKNMCNKLDTQWLISCTIDRNFEHNQVTEYVHAITKVQWTNLMDLYFMLSAIFLKL